jgi:hypothetical protein
MKLARGALASGLLAATAMALPAPAAPDTGPDADYVVMPFDHAKALLSQCSRPTPSIGELGWTPSSGDVARFEAALPKALAQRASSSAFFKAAPKGWLRQYVGMIRKGRRVIYGNFFPTGSDGEFNYWRRDAVAVCDGGAAFFGAEFDVDRNTITDIEFNGYP